MTRRKVIAVLGSNGQVAAEVVLRLQNKAGFCIRPISRSAGGSAFLRLAGVDVTLGDISRSEEAQTLLAQADVVANFALATGEPGKAMAANRRIIEESFRGAPKSATIVFFSTAAVYGEFDVAERRIKSFYGSMKLSNEKLVRSISRKTGQKAYILRLGHVIGTHQNITEAIRSSLLAGPISVPYPERPANVTSTEAIADVLLAIADNRAGTPGTYDLVNRPQWTWREVLEREAQMCKLDLTIVNNFEQRKRSLSHWLNLKAAIAYWVNKMGMREMALKFISRLPIRMVDVIKADYAVERARHSIAEYNRLPPLLSPSLVWPAISPQYLPGQSETMQIIESMAYQIDGE
jgi:nucleoside-diphosphate-sugar epimerase